MTDNQQTITSQIVIIGGGPAGLSAAYSASKAGAEKILIIERDRELGGILQQCIHNGFGLKHFKEELTGPSYAERCIELLKDCPGIEIMTDTMVLDIMPDKTVITSSPETGLLEISAQAIILAMGCRERTRGAIRIPGERPAGVFTAGAAQRMVNMEGFLPGKTAVILGSGDIGLIMARRLTLEGIKVLACIELSPYSNGLTRNIVQCLNDYDIPLYLSHTIAQIHGKDRVSGVTCVKVDEKLSPVAGSEFHLACDTVLLSVGLIPENELSSRLKIALHDITAGPIVDQYRQTNLPGFFAAGNVVHVHDLADFASEEAAIAGRSAVEYINGTIPPASKTVPITTGQGLRTIVPQQLKLTGNDQPVSLFIRPSQPQRGAKLLISSAGKTLSSRPIPVARPGEMIVATLTTEILAQIDQELLIELKVVTA